MAYPAGRSMNGDLHEGSTDGKYKKVIRNRGGVVESATYEDRAGLDDVWYGIHELEVKIMPDGTPVRTPNYVATRKAQIDI